MCAKPRGSVRAYDNVFLCESLSIAVGKSRKATKYKNIAYLFNTLRCQLFIHQLREFRQCKLASLGMLKFELKADKWILVRPAVVYRYLIYGAEALNHLHYIVVR